MKKITRIFVILTFLFMGIYGVKAEQLEGTCTLNNNTINSCSYECSFSSSGEQIKFGFGFKSNNSSNNINYDFSNTLNVSKENFGVDYTDDKLKTFEGNSNACSIFKTTSTTQIYDENNCEDCLVYKCENDSTYGVYKIVSYPVDYFKDTTYDFACRPIKATMEISSNTKPEEERIDGYDPDKIYSIKIIGTQSETNTDSVDDNTCGLLGSADSKTVGVIKKIYGFIKILIPVIIIALSIADFLKIVFTGKDDDMKKAINNLVKRMIVAVAFILVPTLVSILIDISGITSQYSGVSDGIKTVFCILS